MITMTEVDGLRVVTAPTTGPTRGGIVFRVGWLDEPFACRGLTHLIEHLAMFRLGLTDFARNGQTAQRFTHFFCQGSPEQVTTCLRTVCGALGDLPLERLDAEKRVLAAESNRQTMTVGAAMEIWRYGARGMTTEWGLSSLSAPTLEGWARRFFTRENAVVWFAGDELPDLDALALPRGALRPLPPRKDLVPVYPGFFNHEPQAIGWQGIVPRSTAASLLADVLRRQLFARLRQETGYSYRIDAAYTPLDADRATLTCQADVAADTADATFEAFVNTIDQARRGDVDAQTLDAARNQHRQTLTHPDGEALALPSVCADVLLGARIDDPDRALRETDHLDQASLRQVAEEAMTTALLAVPPGQDATPAGYARVPSQEEPVAGKAFAPVDGSNRTLTIGPDGVTATSESGSATVRFADCAGMLAWPDGARMLVAGDANVVRIEPTLWRVDPHALAMIDRSIEPDSIVRRPPRPVDQIPEAMPHAADQRYEAVPPRGLRLMRALAGFFLVMAAMWTVVMVGLSQAAPPSSRIHFWLLAVPLWLVTIWLWVVRHRRDKAWRHGLELTKRLDLR